MYEIRNGIPSNCKSEENYTPEMEYIGHLYVQMSHSLER